MPSSERSPAERESLIVRNPELFAARLTLQAWRWKNIDGWQRELLNCPDRYIIVKSSRQSGKSATLAVKAVHRMLTVPEATILFVAEQRQANEDLRKVKQLVHAYDKLLREKYEGKLTCQPVMENITSIELASGSRCIALPANDKIRGFSAPSMVILDEIAFVENDKEVFMAVDPMIEVNPMAQLILASTPNSTMSPSGTGENIFFHEWRNPRYTHFGITWRNCPRISPESIEEKRQIYGDNYVEQEYECEFLDSQSSLFDEQGLNASDDSEEVAFTVAMQHMRESFASPNSEVSE